MTDYLDRTVDLAELAPVFDELTFWSSRFGALLVDNLELRRGITILDVGCGAGFPLFELAHVHGPSCRVVGADVWSAALQRAEAKRRTYALHHAALAEASGDALPFRDASFDLVVSNLGVNNFAHPERVFAECGRVARPGGRLALTTNLSGHMRELYALFREVLGDFGRDDYLARLDADEARRGTVESVAARMEGGGFAVARAVEGSFRMRFADGSALLRHWLVIIGFLPAWRGVVDPEDARGVFNALERRLNEEAAARGALETTVPMLYLEGVRR